MDHAYHVGLKPEEGLAGVEEAVVLMLRGGLVGVQVPMGIALVKMVVQVKAPPVEVPEDLKA